MGEFFRGWKRKVGVLTLGLAVVAMAGWVRSLTIQDRIAVFRPRAIQVITLMDGELNWTRFTRKEVNDRPMLWRCETITEKVRMNSYKSWEYYQIHWHWQWGGFDFGAKSLEMHDVLAGQQWERRLEVWQIPYWSLVLPLTLISAYLLLSKPRQSTQTTTAKPIKDEEGGATS